MAKFKVQIFLFLILFSLTFGPPKICLPKDLIQSFESGKINWTKGVVVAWGEGYAPAGIKDKRLAKELAKRAATLEARKNLIGIIKTIPLDSKISIEDIVKSWDMAEESINRASHVSEIRSEFLPNGRARVTLELKIYGKLADTVYPFSPEMERIESDKVIPVTTQRRIEPSRKSLILKETEKPSLKNTQEAKEGSIYTGIIIDARNFNAKPALFPKIFNEKEELIYNYTKVAYSSAMEEGMVGYARDLKSAQRNLRVKPHPLVLRAVGVKGEGQTDVVIKDSDAKKLMKEEKEAGFLKQGKVVIVVDK